jgi:hypothetical protein
VASEGGDARGLGDAALVGAGVEADVARFGRGARRLEACGLRAGCALGDGAVDVGDGLAFGGEAVGDEAAEEIEQGLDASEGVGTRLIS